MWRCWLASAAGRSSSASPTRSRRPSTPNSPQTAALTRPYSNSRRSGRARSTAAECGRVTTQANPKGSPARSTAAECGRVTTQANPKGSPARSTAAECGRVTTQANPKDSPTRRATPECRDDAERVQTQLTAHTHRAIGIQLLEPWIHWDAREFIQVRCVVSLVRE